jgi:hypothetical protein
MGWNAVAMVGAAAERGSFPTWLTPALAVQAAHAGAAGRRG